MIGAVPTSKWLLIVLWRDVTTILGLENFIHDRLPWMPILPFGLLERQVSLHFILFFIIETRRLTVNSAKTISTKTNSFATMLFRSFLFLLIVQPWHLGTPVRRLMFVKRIFLRGVENLPFSVPRWYRSSLGGGMIQIILWLHQVRCTHFAVCHLAFLPLPECLSHLFQTCVSGWDPWSLLALRTALP